MSTWEREVALSKNDLEAAREYLQNLRSLAWAYGAECLDQRPLHHGVPLEGPVTATYQWSDTDRRSDKESTGGKYWTSNTSKSGDAP